MAIRGAPLTIVHEFHKPPYGGGNQFLLGLKREWERQGHDVACNRLGARTRAVLFNSFNFDFAQLRDWHRNGVRMVHRVDGPIGAYRGQDDSLDRRIWELNQDVADATVFQSRYSLEKHHEMGFEFRDPIIIPNAADPALFRPADRLSDPGVAGVVRLVSVSWSDNPRKGADVYRWLDEHLDFTKYAYTFVGRIAGSFRHVRVVPPVDSARLADVLRQHHIFVTASQNDPCSNALIEALSCGLPAVYLKSGGHPELVGSGGMGFSCAEEVPGCLARVVEQFNEFRRGLQPPSLADVAQRYYQVMIRA